MAQGSRNMNRYFGRISSWSLPTSQLTLKFSLFSICIHIFFCSSLCLLFPPDEIYSFVTYLLKLFGTFRSLKNSTDFSETFVLKKLVLNMNSGPFLCEETKLSLFIKIKFWNMQWKTASRTRFYSYLNRAAVIHVVQYNILRHCFAGILTRSYFWVSTTYRFWRASGLIHARPDKTEVSFSLKPVINFQNGLCWSFAVLWKFAFGVVSFTIIPDIFNLRNYTFGSIQLFRGALLQEPLLPESAGRASSYPTVRKIEHHQCRTPVAPEPFYWQIRTSQYYSASLRVRSFFVFYWVLNFSISKVVALFISDFLYLIWVLGITSTVHFLSILNH